MTITIGPNSGDFHGTDSFALQRAADELARLAPGGGGTLIIGEGRYTMFDSLHIRVPMTVRGQGAGTVLQKCPSFRTPLLQDFDLSEWVMRVADPSSLRIGMGVAILDQRQKGGWDVNIRTITAIDGNDIHLDRRPERDYSLTQNAWAQGSFPLISAVAVDDTVIEDLVVEADWAEGAKKSAPPPIPTQHSALSTQHSPPEHRVDGCRSGGIYFHHARRCAIRRCIARNLNSDGFSWQTTEDVVVEDCHALGNAGLGFHPGTGSPRTTIRNCRAIGNGQDGLFLCWGVRFGRFENNVLEDNGRHGISIGHKDTDNLFVNNQCRRNGRTGVNFRNEIETNAGHRCTFEGMTIEDNGRPGEAGVGLRIGGATRDTVIRSSTIRDTREPSQKTQFVAVEAGPKASRVGSWSVVSRY